MFSEIVWIADVFVTKWADGDDSVWVLEAIFDVLVSMFGCFEEFLAEWTRSRVIVHIFLYLF